MTTNEDRSHAVARQRATTLVARDRWRRGFSLLELMIVIAIMFTVAGITTIAMMPVMKQQHVTSAYNATLTTLRRAHDQAAADMRVYVVSFAAPGTITVAQNTLG